MNKKEIIEIKIEIEIMKEIEDHNILHLLLILSKIDQKVYHN